MKKEYLISLVIVVVGVGAAACVLFLPMLPGRVSVAMAPTQPAPTGAAGATGTPGATPTPIATTEAAAHNDTTLLPHAPETYQVMQASSTMPKIVQATIDPLGVHVGDTQHLSVILQDPNQIVSAEALIQTDHGTTTLKLSLVGPTQVSELLPQKYYIDSQNNLAFVNSVVPVAAKQGVALAATGGDATYASSWLVHDTHDTTYITTFVVKDSAGNKNSVSMAWSDACAGFPMNGAGILSNNCSVTSIDGVENGSVTIGLGHTLTLSAPFVYSPGYNVAISGGTISLGTGGVLKQGFLYGMDADGDGYSATNGIVFSTASSLSGYVHRYNLTGTGDCNDSDANVHPGQSGYFTTPTLTDLGSNTYDYDCNGTISYHYSGSGGLISAGSCAGPTSCNAPAGTLGIYGTVGCGISVPEVVDQGNVATCSAGHTCDIWSVVASGYTQGCD
jgi:hypothetical protein